MSEVLFLVPTPTSSPRSMQSTGYCVPADQSTHTVGDQLGEDTVYVTGVH